MWMSEGRRRDEWDRFALLVSTIINVNKPAGARLLPAWRVNPFGKRPGIRYTGRISDPEKLTQLFRGE